MEVINELLKDLTEISQEYNDGIIDKDELDIKLGLLVNRIECVELNFNYQPMCT
jgi:hypothetical protein